MCDFLLVMDVKEWINVQMRVHVLRTFRNSSTRSHASEGENRTIEIAAKIASLNGHEILSKTQYLFFS